ncbi:MAG: hypothetical protein R2774_07925 [Saprospiraceae bacterium]
MKSVVVFKSLIVLFIILCFYKTNSQELFYNVYNYTSREIDLDMLVFEMVQDRNGLVWIRDYNSIGIFDGKKFQNVTKLLKSKFNESIEIYDVHADMDGQIWVSCNFGLFKYASFYGFVKFTPRDHIEAFEKITSISNDCNDNLYLGTAQGVVFKVDGQTKQPLLKFNLPIKTIVKNIYVSSISIFVSSNHGIFKCDTIGNCKLIYTFPSYSGQNTFADNRFQKIKPLKNGLLLANDSGNKLLMFNEDGLMQDSIIFHLETTDKFVSDWLEISNRHILIATDDGVYNYDPESKFLKKKQQEYLVKNQFYNTQLLSLLMTKNQTIYFGTSTNISKINIQNEQFLNYNYIYPSRTLLVKEIEYLDNQWVIVTEKDGILLFDPIALRLKKVLDIGNAVVEHAVYDPKVPCIWIATKRNILKVGISENMVVDEKYTKSGFTTSMSTDENSLWFTSGSVLYELIKFKKQIKKRSNDSNILNNVVCLDTGETITAGTNIYKVEKDGLRQLSIDGFVTLDEVRNLVSDHSNYIYFTCKGQLFKYHMLNGTVKVFDMDNGLPDEGLSYITFDDDSNLWLCTRASGLCRFNIQDESVRYFKEGDGLVDNIYLFGISTVKKGIVAAHRWQFFSYYQPKNLKDLLKNSTFLFENILINNKNKTSDVLKSGKITVPSVNSLISMNIAFPSHLNSQQYAMQYRLKSENDTIWSEIGSDHKLIINQLAPGKYNLELKATNIHNTEDSVVTSLSIVSLSPFYMRWWFFLMMLFASYGLIYLIYHFKKQQRKKMEHLRSTISKDLHDEMGSNLSSIMLMGEMAIIKNDASSNTLSQIVEKTRYVMQSMSDIVWSINPGNDTLPNIIHKIQATCLDVLEPADINVSFKISDAINSISLEMAKRQAFYMILKEAVNNCAKYSRAKNVTFSIALNKTKVEAYIEDDGIGFDIETVKMGNGLRNILQRAEVIGGHANINSTPNVGTRITVTIPIN